MEKKRVFDVGMLPDKWHSCWGICLIMTLLFVNSPLALFAELLHNAARELKLDSALCARLKHYHYVTGFHRSGGAVSFKFHCL